MKNQKKSAKKKSTTKPSFQLENLEQRVLMSAASDPWEAEIGDLTNQWNSFISQNIGQFASSTVANIAQEVNGTTEMYPTLDALLTDKNQLGAVSQSIQSGLISLIQDTSDTATEIVDDLNGKSISLSSSLGAGVSAKVSASDDNGAVNLGIDLVWDSTDNRNIQAHVGDLVGLNTWLKTHITSEMHIQATLDGLSGVEIGADSRIGVYADVELDSDAVDTNHNPLKTYLGLVEVEQIEESGESAPDLRIGGELKFGALNSTPQVEQVVEADLELKLVANAGHLGNGFDTSTVFEISKTRTGTWNYSNEDFKVFQNASMGDVLGQVRALSAWLNTIGRSDIFNTNFGGLSSANLNQFVNFAEGLNAILDPEHIPNSLQDFVNLIGAGNVANLVTNGSNVSLEIPMHLAFGLPTNSGSQTIVQLRRQLLEGAGLAGVAANVDLQVTANASIDFTIKVDLSGNSTKIATDTKLNQIQGLHNIPANATIDPWSSILGKDAVVMARAKLAAQGTLTTDAVFKLGFMDKKILASQTTDNCSVQDLVDDLALSSSYQSIVDEDLAQYLIYGDYLSISGNDWLANTGVRELGLSFVKAKPMLVGSTDRTDANNQAITISWKNSAGTTLSQSVTLKGTADEQAVQINQAFQKSSHNGFRAFILNKRLIIEYSGSEAIESLDCSGLVDMQAKTGILSNTLDIGRYNKPISIAFTIGNETKTLTVDAKALQGVASTQELVSVLNSRIPTEFHTKLKASLREGYISFGCTEDFSMVADANAQKALGLSQAFLSSEKIGMQITLSSGGQPIGIDFSALTENSTIQDVLSTIETKSNHAITYSITTNADNVQVIELKSSTAGVYIQKVENVNGSYLATWLGIAGNFAPDGLANKVIVNAKTLAEGGENIVKVVNPTIAVDFGLQGTDLNIGASYGPLGVNLTGKVDVQMHASAVMPDSTKEYTVSQLAGWLLDATDSNPLNLDKPVVTWTMGASQDLNHLASFAVNATLGNTTLKIGDVTIQGELAAGSKLKCSVDAQWEQNAESLNAVGMEGVKTLVKTVIKNVVVNGALKDAALNTDLPLLGQSLADLMPVVSRANQLLNKLDTNHSVTLQELAQVISSSTGIKVDFTLSASQLGFAIDYANAVQNQKTTLGKMSFGVASIGGDAEAYLNANLHVLLQGSFGLSSPEDFNFTLDGANSQISGNVEVQGSPLAFDLSLGNGSKSFPLMEVVSTTGNPSYVGLTGHVDIALADMSVQQEMHIGGELNVKALGLPVGVIKIGTTEGQNFTSWSASKTSDGEFDLATAGFGVRTSSSDPYPADSIVLDLSELSIEPDNLSLFEKLKLAADGLDAFLGKIQSGMTSQFLSSELRNIPLVGDSIVNTADFLTKFQKEFVTPFRNFANTAVGLDAVSVANYLASVIGKIDSGIPNTSLLCNLDAASRTWAGRTFDTNCVGGIQVLQTADSAEWHMKLQGKYSLEQGADFDLGFPGLGLSAEGGVDLSFIWTLEFGFGISQTDGAYLILPAGDELTLDFTAAVGSTLTGSLGFLGMEANTDSSKSPQNKAILDLDLGVDLNDKNLRNESDDTSLLSYDALWDEDEKVGFNNLGSGIVVDTRYTADLDIDMDVTLGFSADVGAGDETPKFPNLDSNFVFKWEAGHGNYTGTITEAGFTYVNLDLGKYINNVLMPMARRIQQVLEPIQPLIDFLQAEVPVINKLPAGEIHITVLDLVKMYGSAKGYNFGMLDDIIEINNLVNTFSAVSGNPSVKLGAFMWVEENATGGRIDANVEGEKILKGLQLPDLDGDDVAANILQFSTKARSILNGNDWNAAMNAINRDAISDASSSLSAFDSDLNQKDSSGWDFPIITNAATEIFGLLMGRQARLVTYDMAPLKFDFDWSKSYPIVGPLCADIGFDFGVCMDLEFGYDTQGLADWKASDYEDDWALFNGFYINDLANGTDDGADVAEVVFHAGIFGGASIAGRAGVRIAVNLDANLNLNDPDHDGRVRLYELKENFDQSIFAVFDTTFTLGARAYAYLDYFIGSKEWDLWKDDNLVSFDVSPEREARPAHWEGNDLVVNAGKYSEKRINKDLTDNKDDIKVSVDGNKVTVRWAEGGNSASETYTLGSGKRLVIDTGKDNDTIVVTGGDSSTAFDLLVLGGQGTDTIDLSGFTTSGVVIVKGQEDNDYIRGSKGNDYIFGDDGEVLNGVAQAFVDPAVSGDDVISGEAGDDVIFGGAGKDKITGGSGTDIIFGDGGRLVNGIADRSNLMDEGGDDTIFGDAGTDYVYAGAGNDKVDGGAGDDFLYGDKGVDTIFGGSGNDTIDGGAGIDILFGDSPIDGGFTIAANSTTAPGVLPWAHVGTDLRKGKDSIRAEGFGFDPDHGVSGTHETNYVAGADTISGGAGSDIIFGDRGSDSAEGGNDIIDGGIENDFIDGDGGDDQIYGGKGEDVLYGGLGNDLLVGGADSDIVFGDNGWSGYTSTANGTLYSINPDDLKKREQQELIFGKNIARNFNIMSNAQSQDEGGNDVIEAGLGADFVDGQSGDDTYSTMFTGEYYQGYTNIMDSGNDEADSLTVYGTSMADQLLIRASDAGLGMVALLPDDGQKTKIERVNFWQDTSRVNSGIDRLTVNAGLGDDTIAIDSTIAATTVNSEGGNDHVTVGQMFHSNRDADSASNMHPVDALDSEANSQTIATTQGYLTPGPSHATSIDGGTGDDAIELLHTSAALTLAGGAGNDIFDARLFVTPEQKLVLNGPVSIDGGVGSDTYNVTGSEISDTFIFTAEEGLLSSGITAKATSIENFNADGAEGDDFFNVISSKETDHVRFSGGLGNDTFTNGGANADLVVQSADFRGHSAVIDHEVTSTAAEYSVAKANSLLVNVIDTSGAAPVEVVFTTSTGEIMDPRLAIVEGDSSGSAYVVRLSKAPVAGETVVVTVIAPEVSTSELGRGQRGVLISSQGDATWGSSTKLEFNSTNWSTGKTVYVNAAADRLREGNAYAFLNHSVSVMAADGASLAQTQVGMVRSVSVMVVDSLDDSQIDVGLIAITDSIIVPQTATGSVEVALKNVPVSTAAGQMQVWFEGELSDIANASLTWNSTTGKLTVPVSATDIGKKIQVHYSTNQVELKGQATVDLAYGITQSNISVTLINEENPSGVAVAASGGAGTGLRYMVDGTKLVFVNVQASGVISLQGITGTIVLSQNGGSRELPQDATPDQINNEPGLVLIEETNGSTDVSENVGTLYRDSYTITLTQKPADPNAVVTVQIKPKESIWSINADGTYNKAQQVEVYQIGNTLVTDQNNLVVTFDNASWTQDASGNWTCAKVTVYVRAIVDANNESDALTVVPATGRTIQNIKGTTHEEGAGGSGSGFSMEPLMVHYGSANITNDEKNNYEGDFAASISGNQVTIAASSLTAEQIAMIQPDYTLVGTNGDNEGEVRRIDKVSLVDGVYTLTLNQGFASQANFQCVFGKPRPNLFVNESASTDRVFINNMDNSENATSNLEMLANDFRNDAGKIDGNDKSLASQIDALRFHHDAIHENGINFAGMEYAEINLGTGADTFSSTAALNRADRFQTFTVVNSGTGNDVLTVDSYKAETDSVMATGKLTAVANEQGKAVYRITNFVRNNGLDVSTNFVGLFVEITDTNGMKERRRIDAVEDANFILDRAFSDATIGDDVAFALVGPVVSVGSVFAVTSNVEQGISVVTIANSQTFTEMVPQVGDVLVLMSDTATERFVVTGISGQEWTVAGVTNLTGTLQYRMERQLGDGQLVFNAQEGDDTINAVAAQNSIIAFGGFGHDVINAGNSTYVFGDRGQVLYKDESGKVVTRLGSDGDSPASGGSDYATATEKGEAYLQTDGVRRGVSLMRTMDNETVVTGVSMDDEIHIAGNQNIAFGGAGADIIHITGNTNVAVGDAGQLVFKTKELGRETFGDEASTWLKHVSTESDSFGGNDTITTGDGNNVLFGGTGSDTLKTQKGDDVIVGDGGYLQLDQYRQNVVVSNTGRNAGADTGSAGDDVIRAGTGNNTVLGGLGNDSIVTGFDDQSTAADLRDKYSNDSDVVLGDNGYRTFQGNGLNVAQLQDPTFTRYQGENQTANSQVTANSTLSFNFRGSASRGINTSETAGAAGYASANWNNIVAPSTVGTYGNDAKETIYDAQGKRLDGLALSYGGSEEHRQPISVPHQELLAYGLQNYNPETIVNAETGILSKGDGYLMGGGLRSTAPNSQCENKLEVEMDGLSKYFSSYTVVVYIDAPAEVSSLIQNPQDSTLGSQIGRGESVRKVAISETLDNGTFGEKDAFYVDDPTSTSDATYSQFNGQYVQATAKNALQATQDGYRNYVVFEGLTSDRFVVTITDGVLNVNYNGRDLASIAGIQIIGTYHQVDKVESSRTEAGGDDTISTGGGDDVVIGGLGNDNIATFGDVRDGIVDADTVMGDNGAVTLMDRGSMRPEAEVVNAMTTGVNGDVNLDGVGFNDILVTGNGNDVVFGGEGNDRINTSRQDEMVAGIASGLDRTPEALSYEHLSQLQNMDTADVEVVNINFSYSYNDSSKDDNDLKVTSGQFAGVVQSDNWNNVNVNDSLNPTQNPNPYDAITFKKGDGSDLGSDFNINLRAVENGNSTQLQTDRSNGHDQIVPDSDNSRMYEGYLWAQKQQTLEVNLNNIGNKAGFETYDVYVYIDGDDERTDTDCWLFEIMGTGQQSKYLNDWRGQSFNGEFREVTATTKPTVDNGLNVKGNPNQSYIGNYVVFRNVSVKDFQVSIKNVLNSNQTLQQPLSMPSIAAIQVVGTGREKVNTSREALVTGTAAANAVAMGGDFDKDVVLGDNGYANYTLGIPFGVNDQTEWAQNKAFTVVADPNSTLATATAASQSDVIVAGRNQDLVMGGNGADAIDTGMGHDVVFADNGIAEMVDYNPIGVRLPNSMQMLDNQSQVQDNDAYIGRANSDANQFLNKLGSNYDQLVGVKLSASTQGGSDMVDAGQDNDLVFGQEGDDILIDNEGKDDVVIGNVGSNTVTNPRIGLYADVNQYLGDLSSVLSALDQSDKNMVNAFAANDFGGMQMQTLGEIIQGKGLATTGTGTGTGTGSTTSAIEVFSNTDTTVTLAANQEIEIYSTTYPTSGGNILLAVNNVGSMIPSLQYSWTTGTTTSTVNGQLNSWYYTVDVPDSPNTTGKYVLRIKALTAGSFKIRLGY